MNGGLARHISGADRRRTKSVATAGQAALLIKHSSSWCNRWCKILVYLRGPSVVKFVSCVCDVSSLDLRGSTTYQSPTTCRYIRRPCGRKKNSPPNDTPGVLNGRGVENRGDEQSAPGRTATENRELQPLRPILVGCHSPFGYLQMFVTSGRNRKSKAKSSTTYRGRRSNGWVQKAPLTTSRDWS